MINYIYIIGLSLALIIDFGMIIYLNKKLKGNGFYKVMISIYVVLIFYFVGLILQLTCKNSNIPLIYFDYITYKYYT